MGMNISDLFPVTSLSTMVILSCLEDVHRLGEEKIDGMEWNIWMVINGKSECKQVDSQKSSARRMG